MAKRGRPRYPDILTPREWEVLALLREGLSNEGIAARLDITERTARYHVSEILGKLGVTSRDEAAAWQPEERRPWWAGAALPVALFWRKVSFGWLSPATTAVLGVVVIAGVGLLVWGLVRTQWDGGLAVGTDTTMPVSDEAFSVDGVPTTYVRVHGGLQPIDPASAQDLPGYDLGPSRTVRGPAAISPDGRTAAITVQVNQDPPQLELLDLKYWRPAGTLGFSGSEMHWSRDGERLYLRTDENCTSASESTAQQCESTIVTIDVANRKVLFRTALPPGHLNGSLGFAGPSSFAPAPDGRTVYLFGNSVANPSTARLLTLDLETGTVREELELPEVLWAARTESSQLGEGLLVYYPAFVVRPDGRRAYIVHADTDRITVVNLEAMRILRSSELRPRTSLLERFLSFLAKDAHADGRWPYHEKWATISADGRYLYVGGGHAVPEEGESWVVGVYPSESAGLRVIDTESLEIIAEIEPGGECVYRNLAVHPSGRYLYANASVTDPGQTGSPRTCRGDGLLVLDARSLEVTASRSTRDAVLVAPAVASATVTP